VYSAVTPFPGFMFVSSTMVKVRLVTRSRISKNQIPRINLSDRAAVLEFGSWFLKFPLLAAEREPLTLSGLSFILRPGPQFLFTQFL
jgi:hypothetical protein